MKRLFYHFFGVRIIFRTGLQDTKQLARVARHSPEKLPELVAQRIATEGKSHSTPRSKPTEGISYTPGVGCDYQIAVTAQVWEQLNNYKEEIGAATLSGAIARLLDEVKQKQLLIKCKISRERLRDDHPH